MKFIHISLTQVSSILYNRQSGRWYRTKYKERNRRKDICAKYDYLYYL